VALRASLLERGEARVRLERRVKNLTRQLDTLAAAGYTRFASVRGGEEVDDLDVRTLG
jgi:histidyl-tRNA synthetase